jgi:cyclopropane fatty-acyl-phospholipid synthase-like methyltransferase
MVKEKKQFKGKGLGIATAHSFEDEPSSMIHEQLARLKFAETIIDMKNKKILDFGCGTGYNSYFIVKRQSPKMVVGIDILEDVIAYCKSNYSVKKKKHVFMFKIVSFIIQNSVPSMS